MDKWFKILRMLRVRANRAYLTPRHPVWEDCTRVANELEHAIKITTQPEVKR